MTRWARLNARQLEVLRWVAGGSPAGVWQDFTYKTTAYALQGRGLVDVDRRRHSWTATITDAGRHYLVTGSYLEPQTPEPPAPTSIECSDHEITAARKRLREVRSSREPRTRRSNRARRGPTVPAGSPLEEVEMRYKIVVSRVQTAERFVRAASEEKAIERVQAELDRPYGFLGGWTTIDTDLDVTEVENAYQGSHGPIAENGQILLSLKEAGKLLGLSYSRLYELVGAGEMEHVRIGNRMYVSRDQINKFITAHTRGNSRLG